MALSTLRIAALRQLRPILMSNNQPIVQRCMPMATTAQDEMKEFWKKNQQLNRPSSPWTVYHMHLPMTTSLTHRITGICMGVVLYGAAIGLMAAPGDFPAYLQYIKDLQLPTALLFSCKTIAAFPLVYHYLNGIRHLSWDAGKGLKLPTQYKTGSIIMGSSMVIAVLLASAAYW